MEILGLLSIIIGIVAGIIALMEKFWGVFSKIQPNKRIFNRLYYEWINSNRETLPSLREFRKVLKFIEENNLSDDQMAFSLLCAIQYGDRSMNKLILKNMENDQAILHALTFFYGRGIRVGWRAEYVLSKLLNDTVKQDIKNTWENEIVSGELNESFERILTDTVENYLVEMTKSNDQKLRAYAKEVLMQIQSESIKGKINRAILESLKHNIIM